MRRMDYKHYRWFICLLIVGCTVFVILSIRQVYQRIYAPTAPITAAPMMTPQTGSPATIPTLPPARLINLSVPTGSVTTGSALFASRPTVNTRHSLYATSNAQVHTIGGGGSGNAHLSAPLHTSGSRGIMYSSAPVIAMASTSSFTLKGNSYSPDLQPNRSLPRRIQSNGDGSYDGETKTEGGFTYYWNEATETWVLDMPVGTTKTEGGITYMWDGSAWQVMTGTDPTGEVPLGDTPWCGIILLALAYCIYRKSICGTFVG